MPKLAQRSYENLPKNPKEVPTRFSPFFLSSASLSVILYRTTQTLLLFDYLWKRILAACLMFRRDPRVHCLGLCSSTATLPVPRFTSQSSFIPSSFPPFTFHELHDTLLSPVGGDSARGFDCLALGGPQRFPTDARRLGDPLLPGPSRGPRLRDTRV